MGYIMDLRAQVGHRPLFMPGAGVFFIDGQNRAMLQRRADNGLWAGTGGSMEPGETFVDTVRREAVEEVGLYPETLELINTYSGESQHYTYPNGDEVYVVAATFACDRYTGTLRVDPEECLDARFFALDAFPPEAEIHPPDRPMIRDLAAWLTRRMAAADACARLASATEAASDADSAVPTGAGASRGRTKVLDVAVIGTSTPEHATANEATCMAAIRRKRP